MIVTKIYAHWVNTKCITSDYYCLSMKNKMRQKLFFMKH